MGSLALQFIAGATPWPDPAAFTGSFYVHVTDVDAAAAEVGDRVEAPWGVEDRDWGQRELVLQDPNGYFVTFTAPQGRAPAHRGGVLRAAVAGVRQWVVAHRWHERGALGAVLHRIDRFLPDRLAAETASSPAS